MVERRRSSGARTTSRAKAKPGINRDYSDIEYREAEIYDGPTPTRGLYRMELVAVGDHTSGDGNDSTKWTLRIMDGEQDKHGDSVAGWIGSKYTNGEGAKWVEQNLAVALGLIKPGGKLAMPYEDILRKAKPIRALIVPERYIPEDGDPEWRASLTSSFLPDGATGVKSKQDDDEDDEEAPPTTRGKTRSQSSRARSKPEPEPEDDEDEDEEEDYDPDDLAEELEGLSLAALKKRARDEFGIRITKGMAADAIIDAVLETLDEAEEDEEPEPEPAKRPARGSSRRTARRGFDDEPPF